MTHKESWDFLFQISLTIVCSWLLVMLCVYLSIPDGVIRIRESGRKILITLGNFLWEERFFIFFMGAAEKVKVKSWSFMKVKREKGKKLCQLGCTD